MRKLLKPEDELYKQASKRLEELAKKKPGELFKRWVKIGLIDEDGNFLGPVKGEE